MKIPDQFSGQLPLREQITYVLSLIPEATADEVAMELMELRGIATEEGVADLTFEATHELEKMLDEELVKKASANGDAMRFCLQ